MYILQTAHGHAARSAPSIPVKISRSCLGHVCLRQFATSQHGDSYASVLAHHIASEFDNNVLAVNYHHHNHIVCSIGTSYRTGIRSPTVLTPTSAFPVRAIRKKVQHTNGLVYGVSVRSNKRCTVSLPVGRLCANFSTCSSRSAGSLPNALNSRLPTRSESDTDDLFDVPLLPSENERNRRRKQIQAQHALKRHQTRQAEIVAEKARNILKARGFDGLHSAVDASRGAITKLAKEYDAIVTLILHDARTKAEAAKYRLQQLRQEHWLQYYENSLYEQLDMQILHIKKHGLKLRKKFSDIQQQIIAVNRRIKGNIGPLYNKASEVIGLTAELKAVGRSHHKFTIAAANYADGAYKLDLLLQPSHLQKIELELIVNGLWTPISADLRPIDQKVARRLHMQGVSVFEVVDSTTDVIARSLRNLSNSPRNFSPKLDRRDDKTLFSPIPRLAHEYRQLHLAKMQYEVFPEIAYSAFWSAVMLTNYIVPVEAANADLKMLVTSDVPNRTQLRKCLHDQKGKLRGHAGPVWRQLEQQQAFSNQLWNISNSILIFCARTDEIVLEYRRLIQGGRTVFCSSGHPRRDLHEFQCRTFRAADLLIRDNSTLISTYSTALKDLAYLQKARNKFDTVAEYNSRAVLTEFLNDSIASQRKWRREMAMALTEAVVWSSTKFLAFDCHKTETFPQVGREVVTRPTAPLRTLQTSSAASTEPLRLKRGSTDWLTQRSLYPHGRRLVVDYILSIDALYLALDGLRSSSVIAFDIGLLEEGHRLQTRSHISAHHIVFATEEQISIVDWMALPSRQRPKAASLLRPLFENEAILKVSLHAEKSKSWLRQKHGITLTNTTEISTVDICDFMQHQLPLQAGDKSTFVKYLQASNPYEANDPREFFHQLAVRPYAALRIFHSLSEAGRSENMKRDLRLMLPATDHSDGIALGPVFIDRSATPMSIPCLTDSRIFYSMGLRSEWLKEMSVRMATLSGAERDVKNMPDLSEALRLQLCTAYAAYYQYTIFREPLEAIALSLGITSQQEAHVALCASWILWASGERNLYLREDDKTALERKSALFTTERIKRIISKDRDANTIREKLPSPGIRRRRNRMLSQIGRRGTTSAQTSPRMKSGILASNPISSKSRQVSVRHRVSRLSPTVAGFYRFAPAKGTGRPSSKIKSSGPRQFSPYKRPSLLKSQLSSRFQSFSQSKSAQMNSGVVGQIVRRVPGREKPTELDNSIVRQPGLNWSPFTIESSQPSSERIGSISRWVSSESKSAQPKLVVTGANIRTVGARQHPRVTPAMLIARRKDKPHLESHSSHSEAIEQTQSSSLNRAKTPKDPRTITESMGGMIRRWLF